MRRKIRSTQLVGVFCRETPNVTFNRESKVEGKRKTHIQVDQGKSKFSFCRERNLKKTKQTVYSTHHSTFFGRGVKKKRQMTQMWINFQFEHLIHLRFSSSRRKLGRFKFCIWLSGRYLCAHGLSSSSYLQEQTPTTITSPCRGLPANWECGAFETNDFTFLLWDAHNFTSFGFLAGSNRSFLTCVCVCVCVFLSSPCLTLQLQSLSVSLQSTPHNSRFPSLRLQSVFSSSPLLPHHSHLSFISSLSFLPPSLLFASHFPSRCTAASFDIVILFPLCSRYDSLSFSVSSSLISSLS